MHRRIYIYGYGVYGKALARYFISKEWKFESYIVTENDFKISKVNGTIIIEKDGQGLAISQAVDEDIWFTTSKAELSLEISMYSRVYPEWQTYMVFEKLMKTIVGRYILSGDNKDNYSILPKDFVDLDSNVIVWHSDSGTDNILVVKESTIMATHNTVRIKRRYLLGSLNFSFFLFKTGLIYLPPIPSIAYASDL